MPPTPPEFSYDVFISYSHRDKAWVRGELLPRLEGVGLKVCVDFRDFRIGAPIIKEMERAVLTSRHTLLVLTAAYLASAWAEFENLMLQTLDPTNQQSRLIPLILEQAELPLRIRGLNYVDLTQADDLAFSWQRLLDALSPATDAGSDARKMDTLAGPATLSITGPAPAPTSPAPAAPPSKSNTPVMRALLLAAFSDEELMTFCFDHFRPVYEKFTSGMTRPLKIQMLIEHCENFGKTVELLARVQEANPYQYQCFEGRLHS